MTKILEEDLFTFDINKTEESLSAVKNYLITEKQEENIAHYYKYRDLLEKHLQLLQSKQFVLVPGKKSSSSDEQEAMSILSIHRLNCLLEEIDTIKLVSPEASRQLAHLLHIIISHLSNLVQSGFLQRQLNGLLLTEEANQTLDYLNQALKQLIGFKILTEPDFKNRDVILLEIIAPAKRKLTDFLAIVQH